MFSITSPLCVLNVNPNSALLYLLCLFFLVFFKFLSTVMRSNDLLANVNLFLFIFIIVNCIISGVEIIVLHTKKQRRTKRNGAYYNSVNANFMNSVLDLRTHGLFHTSYRKNKCQNLLCCVVIQKLIIDECMIIFMYSTYI
jgi:hypothetical protein